MITTQYIYLLQEREFYKTKEIIYKIGMTKKENFKRFNQYPKGSILLFQMICDDCKNIETQVIKLFKQKFKQRTDIGNEYFEGDYKNMIHIIYSTIINEREEYEDIKQDKEEKIEIYECENIRQNKEEKIETKEIQACENARQNKKEKIEMYECDRCGYTTEWLQNFKFHLKRKNACKSIKQDVSIEDLHCKYISIKKTNFQCKKCNKYFSSRQNRHRHNKTCIHEEKQPQIDESKIDELKKKISELESEKINIIINDNVHQIMNNNNHIITNNNYFQINPIKF